MGKISYYEEDQRMEYSRSERIQMAKNTFKNGGQSPSQNIKKKPEEEEYGVDIFLKSAKAFFLRSLFALLLFGIFYGMKKYESSPLATLASDIKKAVESREEQEELEVWIRDLF